MGPCLGALTGVRKPSKPPCSAYTVFIFTPALQAAEQARLVDESRKSGSGVALTGSTYFTMAKSQDRLNNREEMHTKKRRRRRLSSMVPYFISMLAAVLLASLGQASNGAMVWAPQCTDRLRVCQDDETPYSSDDPSTQICSKNQLERATVILTGAAWRSSLYNLWIAQIILEEQLQVPVRIENVNGGDTPYWYYNNSRFDVLDGRIYSWDALDLASSGSMDCSDGFKATYGVEMPQDLQEADCKDNCYPCAHAILEVWPNGQDENYDEYVLQRKTVEDGGRLGSIGEFGWWATKSALDEDPTLSSFRGMKGVNSTAVFRYPLTFGEYCLRTLSEWGYIASSDDPFALDASTPSHFCHFFFEYALLAEYNIVYADNIDAKYHATREVVLERCATNQNTTTGILFYSLCTQYWVTPDDLQTALPIAESELTREGFDNVKFLYKGVFVDDTGTGVLQSTSCPNSTLMPVTPGAEEWLTWLNEGEDGYSRFQNRDYDIVNSYNLQVQPYNMRSEVQEVLEVSARLLQENSDDASPVLISWSRPDSLFLRHKYMLGDEPWGNYSGPEFELAKVQLPDYPSDAECMPSQRSFEDRCPANTSTPANVEEQEQCGYQNEIIYKVFAANLQNYAPEAYRFLRRFQLTTDQQEHLLASFDYDPIYREMVAPTRARTVVCDWVRNNTDIWQSWLPETANQVRCLGELQDPFATVDLESSSTNNETCSGHGTCISTSELLQLHPNAGSCECDQGYVGDDCSGLVDPDMLTVIIGKSFLFWPIFGLQVATILYITWARRLIRQNAKSSVVFQTSHPWFLELILQSSLVGALGPFVWAGPITIIHCILRPILIAVPFAIIQLSIYTKLNRKKLRMAMNTEDLKETLKPICLFLVGLFCLWFLFFTPGTASVRLTDRVWLEYASCEYGSQLSAFEALLFVGCMSFLLMNCRLAVELRLKPTYFNEGFHLMVTSFATLLVAGTGYFASQVVVSPNENAKFVLVSISCLATIWVILGLLINPKLRIHLYSPEINNFKLGLVHPTGDPSLAIGDPVADMPRVFAEANRSRSQVVPHQSRPSAIISVPGNNEIGVTSPPRNRASMFLSAALSVAKAPGARFQAVRRFSQAIPSVIRNGIARGSVMTTPITRRHQVHLENIADLNKLSSFPAPEDEVKRDPHKMHDPLKRGLAYRSPEMYMILEKRIQIVLRENAELTRIIEEHRIDPVTGEMDEDFMDALHRIKKEHQELAQQIEEDYLQEVENIEAQRLQDKHNLTEKFKADVSQIEQEKTDTVEILKAQQVLHEHKLTELEQQAKRMAATLIGTLPPFEIFLTTNHLDQYSVGLKSQGLDSTEKLILASKEDLRHAGLRPGHIRKLQSILASLESATPKVVLPPGAEKREPINLSLEDPSSDILQKSDSRTESIDDLIGRNSSKRRKRNLKTKAAWIENFDPTSGRKYLIHPHTGETKWDDSVSRPKSFRKKKLSSSSKLSKDGSTDNSIAIADSKPEPRVALDCAPIETVYSSDESDKEVIAEPPFSETKVGAQSSPSNRRFGGFRTNNNKPGSASSKSKS